MSVPYESIPPERHNAYLQNAREAVEAATESVVAPAVKALGELTAQEAETYLAGIPSAQTSGDAEATGVNLDSTGTSDIAKMIAENRGDTSFQTMRREYHIAKNSQGRTDLSGPGYAALEKKPTERGSLSNEVWIKMAQQNRPGPDKPQLPSN
jgi:hypothetical protein